MALNLNAKWREHATSDERALVAIMDSLIAVQRPALTNLYALRKVIVKRVQMRKIYRDKYAKSDRRNK